MREADLRLEAGNGKRKRTAAEIEFLNDLL